MVGTYTTLTSSLRLRVIAATLGVALAAGPSLGAPFVTPMNSSPIALSNDNTLLWSVNPSDNSVAVVRTDNNTLLGIIPVGKEPRSIAVNPSNTFAFVANAASSTVSVIRINDPTYAGFDASVDKTLKTGSEPLGIVISPDGRRLFVANSGQDTVTVINAIQRRIIGNINLANSLCNDPDRQRHFQPRGLAVTQDNSQLYVTRFLSFTGETGGRQAKDRGKEGAVCRLDIDTSATTISSYVPSALIRLAPRSTGFAVDSTGDGIPDPTFAFPNQLQSIVIRGGNAYLPNVAASPQGPLTFDTSTQPFINIIGGIGTNSQTDSGVLNLNLGARNPEPGKLRLFFANPWAIAFTNQSGAGNAYAVSAGSDLLVKLNVNAAGTLNFTVDANTTRYIDLNDPTNFFTSFGNAGKNPQGIAITSDGTTAYVNNFVSGNISVVDLAGDQVAKSILTMPPPEPGTRAETVAIGREVFFSSRGNFLRPDGATTSMSNRLSADGWGSCASCHPGGLSDGVVWQFASGPRRTLSLGGTFNPGNRNEQRILNYSAIFDEIEDFELNIRNVSGPGDGPAKPCRTGPPSTSEFDRNHGLLIGDNGNANFAPCVIEPFVKPNAGRQQLMIDPPFGIAGVPALTALKQFVQFAIRVPNGPLNSDGLAGGPSAAQIAAGRTLFGQQCASCHGGGLWTNSIKNFNSPPAGKKITCEVNLGPSRPAGSFCATAPVFGNPVDLQYLRGFLVDVGSFNRGVPGQGNLIGNNVGAAEKAAPLLIDGVSQPAKDALGRDYNGDNRGVGYTIPSLLGVNASPPFLHNGACETLACVVGDAKHRTGNGSMSDFLNTATKRNQVKLFLQSIDAQTAPFE